jgi:hypothetical protein
MALFGINFGKSSGGTCVMPELWQMQLQCSLYTEIQLRAIYTRILSEVFSRCHGISDDFRPLLYTSMEGEGQIGLIEHIVRAMAKQSALVLKYNAGIIVEPKWDEQKKILDAMKKGERSKQTLALSFTKYDRTTMLRQLLWHKYLLLCAENKALNLSTAVQIKINALRDSVSMKDFKAEGGPFDQAREIAQALLDGRATAMDSKDLIELMTPDTGPLEKVGDSVHREAALILGLPLSWITGTAESGLGDSGDKDARAIERGLQPYFWESVYPAYFGLFGGKLKFKTEDYRNITPALDAMRTFQLDDGELLPKEIQQRILYQLLDIQEQPPGVKQSKKPAPATGQRIAGKDAKDDDEGAA